MPNYATLTEVKTVLKTGNEKPLMFSDSLTEVRLKDANSQDNLDIIFDEEQVSTVSSFSRFLTLQIEFTSSTAFKVFELSKKIKQKRLLGTGNTTTNYVTPSGDVTIASAAWGGTIATGDVVTLEFQSHISDDRASEIIDECEIMIDSMVSGEGIDFIDDGDTRLFPTTVPDPIKVAAKYLSAYYIYTDVFQDKFKDESEGNKTYIRRWKYRAEKFVNMYISTKSHSAPRALVFPAFITKFGDADVGPGYTEMKSDYDDVTRDSGSEKIFEGEG